MFIFDGKLFEASLAPLGLLIVYQHLTGCQCLPGREYLNNSSTPPILASTILENLVIPYVPKIKYDDRQDSASVSSTQAVYDLDGWPAQKQGEI
jgi:hypothetical protein